MCLGGFGPDDLEMGNWFFRRARMDINLWIFLYNIYLVSSRFYISCIITIWIIPTLSLSANARSVILGPD